MLFTQATCVPCLVGQIAARASYRPSGCILFRPTSTVPRYSICQTLKSTRPMQPLQTFLGNTVPPRIIATTACKVYEILIYHMPLHSHTFFCLLHIPPYIFVRFAVFSDTPMMHWVNPLATHRPNTQSQCTQLSAWLMIFLIIITPIAYAILESIVGLPLALSSPTWALYIVGASISLCFYTTFLVRPFG